MLLDRCPDYKFVNELEAHKIFDHSGLDSKEQFKIWERAGKTWDAAAIRTAIIQYSEDLENLDADRVQKGRYADGVRKGKWKRRVYVARSDTHEGTDLRPIDVQQGTFSELLDNIVPLDPLNPCFSVRAGVDNDDEDLSEDELACVEDDPNYTIIDPDDEHGVYYTTPFADSDEEVPETSDNSEDDANEDDEDDGDTEW